MIDEKLREILEKLGGKEVCCDITHTLFSGGYGVPKICIKCGKEMGKDTEIDQVISQIKSLFEESKICPTCSQRRRNNKMGYSSQDPQTRSGVEI